MSGKMVVNVFALINILHFSRTMLDKDNSICLFKSVSLFVYLSVCPNIDFKFRRKTACTFIKHKYDNSLTNALRLH